MSSLACKWNWHETGHQVWYDKSTYETIRSTHPLYFYDDFTGVTGGSPILAGTATWAVVDVDAATATIVATPASCGLFRLLLAVGATAQDAVLYHGNNKTFDVTHGLIFETKVVANTLPTGTTQFVAGMASNHDLVKDSVTTQAWFKMEGSGAIFCESDDTGINNDDVATGVTAVAGTANIYRIDFTTLTDVKFFIDGVRVCASSTFSMINSAAGTVLQPYISIDKPADGSEGIVDIDYVKIWSNRS